MILWFNWPSNSLKLKACDVELSRKSFLGLVSKGGVTKV